MDNYNIQDYLDRRSNKSFLRFLLVWCTPYGWYVILKRLGVIGFIKKYYGWIAFIGCLICYNYLWFTPVLFLGPVWIFALLKYIFKNSGPYAKKGPFD